MGNILSKPIEWIEVPRNLMFKHPFTMMVAGATSSGKTHFVRRLLRALPEIMIPKPPLTPLKVLWAYGIWQDLYNEPLLSPYVSVRYHEGLPTQDIIDEADIIVLDDLMDSLGSSRDLSSLFTKGSHHKKKSIIFIVQNIFYQGKQMRNITLNCHYLVLTKNRRDLNQVGVLARQLYSNSKFFMDAYKRAVLDQDYGYLVIDLTPTTEERYRLRSSVTPPEYPISIFVPWPEKHTRQ